MKSKFVIPFAAALLAGAFGAQAKTVIANSGSFADVSVAVNSASPGDTVVIPPGTNSWSSMLSISGITLQGSGTNATVIVDETPPVGNGSAFMQMTPISGALTRVTQIQFTHGVTNNLNFNNYNGAIQVYGQNPNWRIDDCFFNVLSAKAVRVGDDSFGVIDHNVFITFNRISVEVFGTGYGDAVWAAPTQFGSANAVYIENNYFQDGNNFGWVDVSNGARAVYRNNTAVGCFFNTHGAETSQRYRSCRYVEVYNNYFVSPNGTNANIWQPFYTMCDIRGGSAVVFSNTAAGYSTVAELNYYRATDNDPGFLPWYGATGISGWDSNSPALLGGVYSGPATNNLVVTNASWSNNQWAGCTVYDTNSQLMGLASGNNSNTMYFCTSRRPWLQVAFTNGDSYAVYKVYQGIDQPVWAMATCFPATIRLRFISTRRANRFMPGPT